MESFLDLPILDQLKIIKTEIKSQETSDAAIAICLVANVFKKYVEEPRKNLETLTKQNAILIQNQNKFFKMMDNYIKK